VRQHLDTLNGAPADACEEIIAAKYVEHATAVRIPSIWQGTWADGRGRDGQLASCTVPGLQLTILAIVAGNDIVAYSAIPIAPSDVPGEASGDARNTVDLLERTPAPIIE